MNLLPIFTTSLVVGAGLFGGAWTCYIVLDGLSKILAKGAIKMIQLTRRVIG